MTGEQCAHPGGGRSVDAQLVLERMPICAQARSRHARQQHQWARLLLGVPRPNRVDDRRVAHQHGVQRFAEQPFCELGVAAAGPDEIGERSQDGSFTELGARLEQRLGGRGETNVLAVELGERVAPRLELRQRSFRLTARRTSAHLLLLQCREVTPRVLQCFDGAHGSLRVARHALPRGVRLSRRFARRGFPILALARGQRELLAQLAALPVERRGFQLERARGLDATLQRFLQLPQTGPLGREPPAHLVLVAGPRGQLTVNGGEILRGGGALSLGRVVLPFSLPGAPLRLRALLRGRLAALPRVAEPLRCEREIALEPSHFELGVAETALDLRPACLPRVTRLHARFAFMLRVAQARARRRDRLRQLAGAHPERAERDVEVFELAPHQGHRDAEALLHHLAVALGAAPLTRQAPHLRLNFGNQVLEPREIGCRLLEPALRALLPVTVETDAGRLLEQRASLLRFLREQRLDHLRFHHDRGVGAKSGATQQILNVSQPHR